MLEPWIIEQIRKREEEEQRRRREQRAPLDMPREYPRPRHEHGYGEEGEKPSDRGVVIIDFRV